MICDLFLGKVFWVKLAQLGGPRVQCGGAPALLRKHWIIIDNLGVIKWIIHINLESLVWMLHSRSVLRWYRLRLEYLLEPIHCRLKHFESTVILLQTLLDCLDLAEWQCFAQFQLNSQQILQRFYLLVDWLYELLRKHDHHIVKLFEFCHCLEVFKVESINL